MFIIINMKKEVVLYPREKRMLVQVGRQIRLARLRRKASCELTAQRAKISRATLWKIEKGDPAVSMGAYLSVLFALRLEKDILSLAREDNEGHLRCSLCRFAKSQARRKTVNVSLRHRPPAHKFS